MTCLSLIEKLPCQCRSNAAQLWLDQIRVQLRLEQHVPVKEVPESFSECVRASVKTPPGPESKRCSRGTASTERLVFQPGHGRAHRPARTKANLSAADCEQYRRRNERHKRETNRCAWKSRARLRGLKRKPRY